MKKAGFGFVLLLLAACVYADDEATVTVTGDRVSLRSAPKLNAVLLDRAMEGDSFALVDNSNAEWVGVFPPESVDLWVHNEFIEDDKVLPGRLNVRSGPSLSHSVVGVVEKGQVLTIRGETGGWLRIAPPQGSIVWISRRYVDVAGAEKEAVVEAQQAPEINKVMSSAAGVGDLPQKLRPDAIKMQAKEITLSGRLRPAGGFLYKLVNPDVEELLICYVRGNAEQMETLSGQNLEIMGRAYWALNLDEPFVVPVKIRLAK